MSEQPLADTAVAHMPENYERYFVPAIGRPVATDLVRAASLRPGERVLDVGCGTGIVARLAAERVAPGGTVAGLDLHPGMLGVARAATPSGVDIAWHEGDAQEMPIPDASYDVALCQMSLQFVPDRDRALREMHRVLAPGGRLVLNLPGPIAPPMAVLADALGRHVAPEASGFVEQVFSLHDPAELTGLLERAGFRDVTVRSHTTRLDLPAPADFLRQYVDGTPLVASVSRLPREKRRALESDVVEQWKPFETDGGMRLDQGMVTAAGGK